MRRKSLIALAAAVLFAVALVATSAGTHMPSFMRKPAPATTPQDKTKRTPKIPPLASKTRNDGVYIESATIDDTFPGGTLVITVRNDTDKDVASFQVQAGDDVEGTHGAIEVGQPPAITAHSTSQLRIPLPNINSLDDEVSLNAVLFVGGSESGEPGALKFIKRTRGKAEESHRKGGSQ
ncbi:MAG: hypothetical protein QOJ70_340 [Acidobacteriota bacterium]|jgi:hypothetical protein|nr:hypothetical protein [Acidobacteriota bacterium]